MKNIRRLIAIFLLCITYCYVINITNFPKRILVYQDSKINLKLCPFIKLNGEIQTSTNENIYEYKLGLNIGNYELKNIEVKLVDKIKVVPARELNRFKIIYRWCNDCWILRYS